MSIPTILDNLIAMAVVLLILSLVVQSIQSGLKKLLKIKSRQIEDSLIDLFEHVVNKPPGSESFLQQSPILRIVFRRKHSSEPSDPQVKHLYDDVLKEIARARPRRSVGQTHAQFFIEGGLEEGVGKNRAERSDAPVDDGSTGGFRPDHRCAEDTAEHFPDQLPGDAERKVFGIQATLLPC